jgi:hypothetical protein
MYSTGTGGYYAVQGTNKSTLSRTMPCRTPRSTKYKGMGYKLKDTNYWLNKKTFNLFMIF